MTEIVATDDRQSLEGQGLIQVDSAASPAGGFRLPLVALGLSDQEAWGLLGELIAEPAAAGRRHDAR